MPAGLLVTVPVPVPAFVTVSVRSMSVNVAVTVVSAVRVTTQLPVPEQPPPDQPVKLEPASAAAVSVTTVPSSNEVWQVAPQSIPVGLLVTVPLPEPAFEAVSVWVTVFAVKVAVTVVSALRVTTQSPVPEQPPPDQPAKVEPASAAAVSVTTVPSSNEAWQVAPQSIPAGLLVTVPLPEPAFDAVSVCVTGMPVNVAVTVVSAPSVTTQSPVPEQPPPDQPANVEPSAGDAESVTTVPSSNDAWQVAPQSIPAGELVTVPLPEPPFDTVSTC